MAKAWVPFLRINTMWIVKTEIITRNQIHKHSLWHKDEQLSYQAIIHLWQKDVSFGDFFTTMLAEVAFAAYFWETPPITIVNATQPFEYVVINSPQLAQRRPNLSAFAAHFAPDESVVTFDNLGKDARLIVPCPQADPSAYPHLAAFLRLGPAAQQRQFWRCVGTHIAQCLGPQPTWLSTSGLGVSWLHVRLDSQPKYYCYHPYRT